MAMAKAAKVACLLYPSPPARRTPFDQPVRFFAARRYPRSSLEPRRPSP
jgi:hypothetical protein